MKKIFAVLLLSVCTSHVYARSTRANCTYNFNVVNNTGSNEMDVNNLSFEIQRELERKSYRFSDNNRNGTLNFQFVTYLDFYGDNKPYITANYGINDKNFDYLLNDTRNKPYLPDSYDVLWKFRNNYHLGSVNKSFSSVSYIDALRQVIDEIPHCADINERVGSIIDESILHIKATVAERKNINSDFEAVFPSVGDSSQGQYCIVEHTPLYCSSRRVNGEKGLYAGRCVDTVYFKINGDSRVFSDLVEVEMESSDKILFHPVAAALSLPLLAIPQMAGSIITRSIAKNRADKRLQEFLTKFRTCE